MTAKTFLMMMAASVLVACGGSDGDSNGGTPEPTPTPTPAANNTNQNDATSNTLLAELEFPKVKGGTSEVITHTTANYGLTYAIEWDHTLRAQRWTCYTLYKETLATNGNTRKSLWPDGDPWNHDPDLPTAEQEAPYNELSKSYYPGTNAYYEKGHICPSGDRLYNKDANEQTFYMSNILPMVKNFNGGIWEMMEARTRTWASTADILYVCKGGTIDQADQILGKTINNHIVPKYFFMALLHKKGSAYKALGFWVEHLNEDHSKDNLGNYVVSIDELEQKTGIDFFCNLPDDIESQVEASTDKSEWGLQ